MSTLGALLSRSRTGLYRSRVCRWR